MYLRKLHYRERREIEQNDSAVARLVEWKQHVVGNENVRNPCLASVDDGLEGVGAAELPVLTRCCTDPLAASRIKTTPSRTAGARIRRPSGVADG